MMNQEPTLQIQSTTPLAPHYATALAACVLADEDLTNFLPDWRIASKLRKQVKDLIANCPVTL